MNRLQAVIGANYGDEGKGVITDYLSDARTLVVRYNGGSQAGHTVTLPLGFDHSFHHFGAGTFRSSETLLTRDFICNPITFLREHHIIKSWEPRVVVDSNAMVTTPFDMMINQAVERKRGASRHGSCGLGINETVTRHLHIRSVSGFPPFKIAFGDLDKPDLHDRLREIQNEYVPRRCEELGIPQLDVPAGLTLRFLQDVVAMLRLTRTVNDVEHLKTHKDKIVFEGAQGLGLDEIRGIFPHVTRSRPGLLNITKLLVEAQLNSELLDAYYITRSYMTRHGAGPLEFETCSGFRVHDWNGREHNETNPHQGVFRYGLLDPYIIAKRIFEDLQDSHQDVMVIPKLALTCLDQLSPSEPTKIVGHDVTSVSLPRVLSEMTRLPIELESFGPTRDTVEVNDRVRV